MPRARSPKRDEAYKIWLDSGGKKKLKDIASDLGVSETQIRKWKNLDKWKGNVTNQDNSVENSTPFLLAIFGLLRQSGISIVT